MLSEIWGKILQTGAARIYTVLLGLVTLAITARWLGPEGRGQIVAITMWTSLLATACCMSLGQVALHRSARAEGREWVAVALPALLTATAVCSVLGWVAFGTLHGMAPDLFGALPMHLLLLGALSLPLLVWEPYASSVLQGLDRLSAYNRWLVLGRSLAVAAIVLFVVGTDLGVAGVLLGNLMGGLLLCLALLVVLLRDIGEMRAPLAAFASYVGDGAKLHLNALGAFLFGAADLLMLNYFHGANMTGWYQVGVQVLALLLIVPQAVAMVIHGRIGAQGVDAVWAVHVKMIWQTMLLILVLGAVAVAAAPVWVIWLAGADFAPSVIIFAWQVLALPGMCLSVLLAPQWIARGYFWQAAALTLSMGLANLAANLYLIPQFGMYGAAWASAGVYTGVLVGNLGMMIWCQRRSVAALAESAA